MTTDNKLEDAAKERCEYELIVEEYFGIKTQNERRAVMADYESVVNLVCFAHQKWQLSHLPTSTIEGEDRITDFLNKLKEDPYPEDVFLPVSKEELLSIHEMLTKEFNMPLDRLTGHIGRILRKPLMEQAKALLSSKEKPEEDKWIDVKKPPEIGKFVTVLFDDNETILQGRLMLNGWVACFTDGEALTGQRKIIKWQPLPSPPKSRQV